MTEIALREETYDTAPATLVAWAEAASAAHRLAAPLVQTPFVPEHFRPKGNSPEAVRIAEASATAAVLFGAEAGLSPLQALQGVYVISGKPAMYARTMLAVTLGRGHDVWTEELTDTRAIVCGRRRGSDHVERVIWTADRARKAGYTKNAKYQTDPQSMLLARAQSDVCRRIAPDALLGMAYSVEELEDEQQPAAVVTMQRDGAKRTAKRAPIESVQTEEPSLDEDKPIDLVPTDKADESAETGDPRDVPATRSQITKLNIQLQEAGVTDRDEKLAYLSDQVKRDITSSKDLTKAEANSLIDALEQEAAAERATDQGDDSPFEEPML